MINKVFTIANPRKDSSATKYGGKIVVCHPGITDSKIHRYNSMYRSTRGVANPAKTKDTSSKRCLLYHSIQTR
jgi:hypothetical protein